MKVLSPGDGRKGWSTKKKCTGSGNGDGGCGAMLLVEQGDLFTTASSHYDGSTDVYVTFKCPSCGVLTDLGETWESRVPGQIVDALPDQRTWEERRRAEPPLSPPRKKHRRSA
jgi:hypothetical protein